MSAVGAAEVVDGLAGEGFGGEAGAGDDDLAVFVLETGGGGLEVVHFSNGIACFRNQSARPDSSRLPSARWRKVR